MDYPDTAFELDQVECKRTFFFDTTNIRKQKTHDAK